MTGQEIWNLTAEQRKALPAHHCKADAVCPKCQRYNALLAVASRTGPVLQCRDCGHLVRPFEAGDQR